MSLVMRVRLALTVFMLIGSLLPGITHAAPLEQAGCGFTQGFAALRSMIPYEVGQCLENEWHNVGDGNTRQRTTAWHGKQGELVWRKADNWTAYTDGSKTWLNGPQGLQVRPNDRCFPWEAGCGGGGGNSTPVVVDISGGGIGRSVSLTAKTSAGADCSLSYFTPAGTNSVAQGLGRRTAGSDGYVSWSWFIGTNTRPGNGTVVVTCNGSTTRSGISIG